MPATIIRQKLHQFIDVMEDNKLKAIYTLILENMDIDIQRKKLIQLEREKYLRGEGKSYTPKKVKEMALNKPKRHDL